MASMRDAMRRLQIIYEACAPEAQEAQEAQKSLDEFGRLRRKIHAEAKAVRVDLKEREQMMALGGTTTESAEKSYRIRVAIRGLKEQVARMTEIVAKEERKDLNSLKTQKKKDPEREARLRERREVLTICQQHIEELENLEKRKFNEAYAADRVDLLSGGRGGVGGFGGRARGGPSGAGGAGGAEEPDPFMNSELPDIDVEEDFKIIDERNKNIDDDLDHIGIAVANLKGIATNMGQELDKQNEQLDTIEKGVDVALDHVDNLNIKLRKTLDGMMKGDRFMVNCILLCVLLALVAFVASQFAT
ncbi:hypothetical protein HK104_003634 [Borealophlyctis nickersoniae]|nr:hypothetical protein HK104_003634 [Borealophlyctis nickersoniae]